MMDFAPGSPLGGAGASLRRRATVATPSPVDESPPDFNPPLNRDYLIDPIGSPGSGGGGIGGEGERTDMALIGRLLEDEHLDTDTYGVAELRDGFFDALFLRPSAIVYSELMKYAEGTLPESFDKRSPLSFRQFFPRQRQKIKSSARKILTTRAGIKLLKSSGAMYIAYVLCLIPVVREWLGRYSYVIVISTIINHPARPIGSQIDGAVLTTVGTAAGLGWGVVGLLLSTSTGAAKAGYGGILAIFLATFMAVIACVRSYFIRLYQLVLCAGMAICFTCLSEVNGKRVAWSKLYAYAVPWMLGQAISLVVCVLVLPDAGARPLAEAFHQAFGDMQDALVIPRPRNTRLRRRLTQTFVDLSIAYRDMRIDMTITRFHPDDIGELRNRMQGVIRALLSLKTETRMFDRWDVLDTREAPSVTVEYTESPPTDSERTVFGDQKPLDINAEDVARLVVKALVEPTKELLATIGDSLKTCDAVFMDLSGYRPYLGPPKDISTDVDACQVRLKTAINSFDTVESALLASGDLPASYTNHGEIIKLFVFARHIRMAATPVENLMQKIREMQFKSDYPKLYLPSYPIWKALNRTNEQVRHDRGGVTAGSYHTTFGEIAHLVEKIKAREHNPLPREHDDFAHPDATPNDSHATMEADIDGEPKSKRGKLGYRIWKVLHRLQGFESKYALKVIILTALLSIPGYLSHTRAWWNQYDAWWAVSMAWIMSHPRVGGNVHDLIIRAWCVLLGAIWSGAGYAAGNGNPWVMGAFAFVYLVPMVYRFTQSAHPRSGLVGCFSFIIISLGLISSGGNPSPTSMAVTRGMSLFVGVVAAILINWILWPFVARHALRKSLSSMLFFMSIIYRSVVAKYVYYSEGHSPTPEDILRSEMLEGRLREGFVRIRQLLILTRHEIRLRALFDPLPYSALADACERFFEYLLAVRQAGLHYSPEYVRDNDVAAEKLLAYRRDAVASILGNLYILAGAMRSGRKVPRYLPSAAASRKRLLDKMAEVECEMSAYIEDEDIKAKEKWAQIYHYSFNESLTGCVTQLEELEKYTKLIVGEQGFDDEFRRDETDDEDDQDITNGDLGTVR